MKKILVVLASLGFVACTTAPKNEPVAAHEAAPAVERDVASSQQLGAPVSLRECGGYITLNESANGDLAILLKEFGSRCDRLVVTDHSSGKEIKRYDPIKGTSYTLSNKMLDSLSGDCRVNFSVSGHTAKDGFFVYLTRPSCRKVLAKSPNSYQLSNNGNCKLLINSVYSQKNVDVIYCQGATGKDVVSYEWSNNNNCKLMINGNYANKNVGDRFCQ